MRVVLIFGMMMRPRMRAVTTTCPHTPKSRQFDFCNEAIKPSPSTELTHFRIPSDSWNTASSTRAFIAPQTLYYGHRCPCPTLLPCLSERLHHLQNPQITTALVSKQWTTKRSSSHTEKARYERLHGNLDHLGESCDLPSAEPSHEALYPSAA